MLNRWKNAHLGDIFKGLVPLVPLWGTFPDSGLGRLFAGVRTMFQELSDTSTPAHPPVSRRNYVTNRRRFWTVSEWVGIITWTGQAGQAGAEISTNGRCKTKKYVSVVCQTACVWKKQFLDISVAWLPFLLKSLALWHCFLRQIFLICALSRDISFSCFFWHLVQLTSGSFDISFSCQLFLMFSLFLASVFLDISFVSFCAWHLFRHVLYCKTRDFVHLLS